MLLCMIHDATFHPFHWPIGKRLLQLSPMADWRQIQARIRKAKNSPDAQVKLSELYARTHDAMVAWELATIEEKAARNDEAVKWYSVSAERFRRPEWKKRAEEALTRLGAPLPEPLLKPDVEENTEAFHIPASPANPAIADGESSSDEEITEEEDSAMPLAEATAVGSVATEEDAKKKRRRGRRGGRGRRKKGPATATSLPSEAFAKSVESVAPPTPAAAVPPRIVQPKPIEPAPAPSRLPEPAPISEAARPVTPEVPARILPSERRASDPALASRMAQLESMLRRLVNSTPHRLEHADEAPAGPGVFILSDSDLITSYYIESCQTLRVGVGNVVRGGRGGKNPRGGRGRGEDEDLKSKLADHLGINDSKVSQYMKDHCVIRWIQLDDDAAHLAHFAIGVLKTPLNVD